MVFWILGLCITFEN